MIAMLEGRVADRSFDGVILDVGGVGYQVAVPLRVLQHVPERGHNLRLHVYTHVREDQISLFGFTSPDDRRLFTKLIAISGIGPKLALNLLSTLSADEIRQAVVSGDERRFKGVSGVGRKTAQRLILELRDKMDATPSDQAGHPVSSTLSDLQSALLNLGYKPALVDKTIKTLDKQVDQLSFEELLKQALKLLT